MMWRIAASSALFGLALAAAAAAGRQTVEIKGEDPPAKAPAEKGGKKPADKADQKKADPTDAAIAAALAHDPDVRMARAKLQLADAELAKARQAVTVKVITLRSTIEEQKLAVALAQEAVAITQRVVQAGQAPVSELNRERAKLETARAALARAELELKLITGGGAAGAAHGDPHQGVPGFAFNRFIGLTDAANCTACHVFPWAGIGAKPGDPGAARGLEWLGKQIAEKPPGDEATVRLWSEALMKSMAAGGQSGVHGAIPDRIRAALDKKVKLGAQAEKVPLTKALEVFKTDAGLDVPVRGVGDLVRVPTVTCQGEEMTVRAWLQLYEDYSGGSRFYVREYGLLFTVKEMAPPDALTLTQFWEARPVGKKEEKAAPTVTTATGKYHGTAFKLPPAVGEELFRAAATLARTDTNPEMWTKFWDGAWEQGQPVDYLRIAVPDGRAVKFDHAGPVEVMVDLTRFPDVARAVGLKTSDRILWYKNPTEAGSKEFIATVRKLLPRFPEP